MRRLAALRHFSTYCGVFTVTTDALKVSIIKVKVLNQINFFVSLISNNFCKKITYVISTATRQLVCATFVCRF